VPPRMIDYEALWASDKLAECEGSMRAEYTWCYGVSDPHGCFELNLRAIFSKVSPIRPELTQDRLKLIFAEFERVGLLFTWISNGKRYGFWTGSDRPGRLPPPSLRVRYKRFAPPVPTDELAAFEAKFRSGCTSSVLNDASSVLNDESRCDINDESRHVNDRIRIRVGEDKDKENDEDKDKDLGRGRGVGKGNPIDEKVVRQVVTKEQQNHENHNQTAPFVEILETESAHETIPDSYFESDHNDNTKALVSENQNPTQTIEKQKITSKIGAKGILCQDCGEAVAFSDYADHPTVCSSRRRTS
jgi:hypothetical protein